MMRQIEHHEHKAFAHHGKEFIIILDGLKDPLNVGHAFRIGSSMGVKQLILSDNTPSPPSSKINRTARGAQNQVTWEKGNTLDFFEKLKDQGYYILAVEYATQSVDIRELVRLNTNRPVALVLGNEAQGISKNTLSYCDGVGHLPLYGQISSLNVATALAMAAWELIR